MMKKLLIVVVETEIVEIVMIVVDDVDVETDVDVMNVIDVKRMKEKLTIEIPKTLFLTLVYVHLLLL